MQTTTSTSTLRDRLCAVLLCLIVLFGAIMTVQDIVTVWQLLLLRF